MVTITVVLLVCAALWRLRNGVVNPELFLIWIAPLLALRAYGWVISCLDRPARVNPEAQAKLDRLSVTVSIPCLHEDRVILDRALWAYANQTRPPNRVEVVDDGSTKVDYTDIRDYWLSQPSPHTQFDWVWKVNDGKRRAHCTTFSVDPVADIFITSDSDTCPAKNGVDEILKPFADPEVMSVAGVELGMNANENFLTVLQNALQQIAQTVVAAAWSVSGDMFTNRGPFAAYRATMLREVLPLYYNETFYGHRIILGDDSLLALAGSMRGRSVQQLSAFGLTMWPDNIGWHLRQRLRWARGRTIRNFWRMKYYRIGSYIWLFTMVNTYAFFVGFAALGRLCLLGSAAVPILARYLIALTILGWLSQLRCLAIKRSDESFVDRFLLVAIRPIASLWASFVLTRIVRFIGTITCLKQGKASDWTTRQDGPEIELNVQGAIIGKETR
jgi:hyaluronan synthase